MEERFSEPEPNVIDSSAGFSVRLFGQTGMRYTEGHKSVSIDSKVLAKRGTIALFKDSLKAWESPDASALVNDNDRNRIVENIKRAFESRGYELQVHEDFDWDKSKALEVAYTRVGQSYEAITEFRAKLLALLPLATGTGTFLLLERAQGDNGQLRTFLVRQPHFAS